MNRSRSRRLPLLFLIAAAASPGPLRAEPPSGFPHEAWTRVLGKFVDERGRVDYRALAAGRTELDRVLARIAREGPRRTPEKFPEKNDRLAYYLNAYNALVFEGVLKRGPEPESVWKGGFVSGWSFFVGMKVRLDGEETNLKALEDKVIRKGFADPRVHAALNGASLGCPRLPREAFEPARLDTQLDAAMTAFVEEERNVSVDAASSTVTLSMIFDWFEKDFLAYEKPRWDPSKARERDESNVLDYINRYRRSKPAVDRRFRVRYADYDKRINAR